MPTENITLEIDAEAAQTFKSATPEEREKLQVLLGLWLKEFARANAASLKDTMDEINRKALNEGLTPDILKTVFEEE